MASFTPTARRFLPILSTALGVYGATSDLGSAEGSASPGADAAANTPTCQKDFLKSSRADVFKHTAPDSVKTGSKVHGRMQIFAGNGNPDLADEIGKRCFDVMKCLYRISPGL